MTHEIEPIAEYPDGKPAYEIDERILDLDETGKHDEAIRLYEENKSILEAYWAGICTWCRESDCPRSFGADGPCAEDLGMEDNDAWEAFHDQWTDNLKELDDGRLPILWASRLDVYNVAITVRANKRRRAQPLYIELSGQTLALHENGPLGRLIDLNAAAEILDLEQATKVLAASLEGLRAARDIITRCPVCGGTELEANTWEAWCYSCDWQTTQEKEPGTYALIREATKAHRAELEENLKGIKKESYMDTLLTGISKND